MQGNTCTESPTFHACPIKHKNERRLTCVSCFPVQVSVRVMSSQKTDMTDVKSAGSLDGMSMPTIKPVSTYTGFNA
jgi:hypothetical protein